MSCADKQCIFYLSIQPAVIWMLLYIKTFFSSLYLFNTLYYFCFQVIRDTSTLEGAVSACLLKFGDKEGNLILLYYFTNMSNFLPKNKKLKRLEQWLLLVCLCFVFHSFENVINLMFKCRKANLNILNVQMSQN